MIERNVPPFCCNSLITFFRTHATLNLLNRLQQVKHKCQTKPVKVVKDFNQVLCQHVLVFMFPVKHLYQRHCLYSLERVIIYFFFKKKLLCNVCVAKLYSLTICSVTSALWGLVKAARWSGKIECKRRVWAPSCDGQDIWHSTGTASRAHFATYQQVQLR